jgi:hypothetical protein
MLAAHALVTLLRAPTGTEGEEIRSYVGALWLVEALSNWRAYADSLRKG